MQNERDLKPSHHFLVAVVLHFHCHVFVTPLKPSCVQQGAEVDVAVGVATEEEVVTVGLVGVAEEAGMEVSAAAVEVQADLKLGAETGTAPRK